MKIAVCGDVHWSTYSSIIRSRGEKYSKRLHNLINSVNWFEDYAIATKCDKIVYLGDFFDKPELTAEEISALKEIKWAENVDHIILVGNHELGLHTAKYNSAQIFSLLPNFTIISEPTIEVGYGAIYLYLPYIFEDDRKSISSYVDSLLTGSFVTQEVKNIYVFSHNDLQINYAGFMNKDGFLVEDIEKSCSLFINGHLHNCSKFSKNGYNLGNLTGQNFSEDALMYDHHICLLTIDGTRFDKEFINNPYAFNFYKIDYESEKDLIRACENNAVVSFRCKSSKINELKELIKLYDNIVEYRITTIPEVTNISDAKIKELTKVDHIKSFKEYVRSKLDNTDTLDSELYLLN